MSVITVDTEFGPVSFSGSTEIRKNVIVLLDKSGSMSDRDSTNMNRLAKAKNAIGQLQNKTNLDKLIVFCDYAKTYNSFSLLQTVTANGGTSFTSAFKIAVEHFTDGLNIIILVTDGETWEDDVNKAISTVRNGMTNERQVQVHSLGIIGAHHSLLLKLAQIDVPGTALHIQNELDSDMEINELTDILAGLINSADGFKIVSTPKDHKGADSIDISQVDMDTAEILIPSLIQEATKKPMGELAEECDKLEKMLKLFTLKHESRGELHNRIRDLRALAVGKMKKSDFEKAVSNLCFTPKRRKLDDLTNKRILRSKQDILEDIDKEENGPFVFPENLADDLDKCTITQMGACEAYFANDIFGISLNWKRKAVWAAEPELMEVEVQREWITWNGYKSAVTFFGEDEDATNVGVIPNMDGVIVRGFFPLVINTKAIKILEACAALVSDGQPNAISLKSYSALPAAVLVNLVTREDYSTEWVSRIRKLAIPLVDLTLPANFSDLAAKFGHHLYRTPDIVSSLPVFLVRCIIAGVDITDELVYNIFIEDTRRRMQRSEWTMSNLWKSTIMSRTKGSSGRVADTYLRPWDRVMNTGSDVPQTESWIETTPNEKYIDQQIHLIQDSWRGNKIQKIVDWFCKENGRPNIDPTAKMAKDVEGKLEFLATSKLSTFDVKNQRKPDTDKHTDAQLMAEARSSNSMHLAEWFSKSNDLEESAAILSLTNSQRTINFIQTYVKNHIEDTNLWKLKLNMDGFFVLRTVNAEGQVSFRGVGDYPK